MSERDSIPLQISEREPLLDHCGIVAIYSPTETRAYDMGLAGLIKLQTRGQDGAGVALINKNGEGQSYKAHGRIRSVFEHSVSDEFRRLRANSWAFQTRYGTNGNQDIENIQPIVGKIDGTGEVFTLVHNGEFLGGDRGAEMSDTFVFAKNLSQVPSASWDERLLKIDKDSSGAWSLAIITADAMYLMRDSHGIRPLVLGTKVDSKTGGQIHIATSETAALEAMGVTQYEEVLPGSIIKISQNGITFIKTPSDAKAHATCAFEDAYIENPASMIHRPRESNGQITKEPTVRDFRAETARLLANKEDTGFRANADLVIGIPGTGIVGGKAYAETLGLPYNQAISDRRVDDPRTFMTPEIDTITERVENHFLFHAGSIAGRNIVLVDDSIVRGNISKGLVRILKERYAAAEVHIRVLFPPVDKPCYLGINTRRREELVAARFVKQNEIVTPESIKETIEGIRKEIGADSLKYVTAEDIHQAAGTDQLCLGCTVGHYPPVSQEGVLNDRKRN